MGGRLMFPKCALRLALAAALWTCAGAAASTVTQMSVPALADHSGQVIVGKVTAVRSYWAENPRRIESELTLENVEYLKGRRADSTDKFTLIVPGGEVDGMRMHVCCAPDLRVGEKWLLFLLPAYHNHPVVGIHQGAFLIRPDENGVERVLTRTHDREAGVTGVSGGFVQLAGQPQGEEHDVAAHLLEAHNIRLVEAAAPGPQPLSYADFVAQLAPVLAKSRDHQLTAAAGRPLKTTYRPTALRPSRMQAERNAQRDTQPVAPPRGQEGAQPAKSTPRSTSEGKEVRP